jgi:hypothetical protein
VQESLLTDLLRYNVFGVIRVTHKKITVNGTAIVDDGRPISRSVTESYQVDYPVPEGDTGSATFGALLLTDGSNRIAIHEIGSLKCGIEIGNIIEVNKVLAKLFHLIRTASGLNHDL